MDTPWTPIAHWMNNDRGEPVMFDHDGIRLSLDDFIDVGWPWETEPPIQLGALGTDITGWCYVGDRSIMILRQDDRGDSLVARINLDTAAGLS